MMKLSLLACLALALIPFPCRAADDGNLLKDPSFEEGGWSAGRKVELDTTGENARTGKTSLVLYNRAGPEDWYSFGHTVKGIEPGETYRFAFHARGLPDNPLKTKIHWSIPGEPDEVRKLERRFSGIDFELFEIVMKAPDNATRARLVIENWQTGTDVWIDDLFFGPVR